MLSDTNKEELTTQMFDSSYYSKHLVIKWDEELWLDDSDDGGYVCLQIMCDELVNSILHKKWQDMRDDYLIIPAWEVEKQEQAGGEFVNKQIGYGSYHVDEAINFMNNLIELYYQPMHSINNYIK